MADWLGRNNPALTEAFNNVCLVIDREIRAERLLSEKPLFKDAGTCMVDGGPQGPQLATIDRLKEENARLRDEVAALMAAKGHECPPYTKYDLLAAKFVALDQNFKTARAVLEQRKAEIDYFVRREAMLMSKIKGAEERYGIHILNEEPFSPRASAGAASEDEPMDLPPLPPLTIAAATDISVLENDLLQSTQGEPDEDEPALPPLRAEDDQTQVPMKREPSSDIPTFVSERTLKKRRTEVDNPVVKDEPADTSVASKTERLVYPTQESLDLDHIAQRMTTPRKRRQADEVQRDRSLEQRSSLHTPVPHLTRPEEPLACPHGEVAKNQAATSILTPVSGNERPTLFVNVDKTPSVKSGLSRGIEALAEDGLVQNMGVLGPLRWRQSKLGTSPLVEQGHLGRLLSDGRTEHASESEATSQGPAFLRKLPIPQRRELPFQQTVKQGKRNEVPAQQMTPREAAAQQMTRRGGVPEPRTPVRGASPHTSKTRTSLLRQKPVADLRLDDFKINPAANGGHDFAFSEVVREKDDRASLRGCTDMHCCGKQWRAMAMSQRPNPPLTAAQRQEEQKLLERYLGDCSYRLASMTKEERSELWLEAKTEELANRYGKHRHNFPRMQSPPGFWNADFPTTQQLEAEKEEAGQREKQAIAERYKEAMRPGGRWLFRDE